LKIKAGFKSSGLRIEIVKIINSVISHPKRSKGDPCEARSSIIQSAVFIKDLINIISPDTVIKKIYLYSYTRYVFRMKFRSLLFILMVFAIFLPEKIKGQPIIAEKGIIDLRQLPNKNKFYLTLNGEWEFYWKKMLHPFSFKGYEHPVPDIYAHVPSYWTEYSNNNFKYGKYGYATYRLTILLPKDCRKRLAFDVPVFDSAFDLWINDSLLASNGQPGKDAEEEIPGYAPGFFRYIPVTDTLSVLINVSNFHHRRGGFWIPLKIGTFMEVNKKKANSWAGEFATMSLLFGFAMFFLVFFFLYPKDRIMAFFSMALIGLAFRPLFTSQYLINDFISVGWQWTIRMEYFGLYLILFGITWFSNNLYPSRTIKILSWIITIIFSSAVIITLLFPVKIFSYYVLAYYPSMSILISYLLVQSFRGMVRKRVIDAVYFTAFILLAIGVIHDVLVSLGKALSPLGYVMSFVVVVFVFIQAVLLLYKWISAFYEKDKLHKELEFLNKNLEILVNERTLELKTRNEEIEKQNSRIALQNKQLSETLHLKNKIFSVIAHDLRSPVVNILYMLNLLKEDEFKEKYDTFANSSIQYAQLVINLLENMLVWGRGQEDKIKYSPTRQDLANIILTNLSIFKETSDRKDISVNFTQIGNSTAYFDKDLIDIVIRNLLSNAVKYTNRGGRISILLKDKSNDGEGVLLKICDNGVGISQLKQKYLFTITEIESTPGTENEKGTGLGLKLCHELVKINMGSISVESKEGESTCFMIILPDEKPFGAS
jgi:signal transduction histidine kinase